MFASSSSRILVRASLLWCHGDGRQAEVVVVPVKFVEGAGGGGVVVVAVAAQVAPLHVVRVKADGPAVEADGLPAERAADSARGGGDVLEALAELAGGPADDARVGAEAPRKLGHELGGGVEGDGPVAMRVSLS